MLVNALIINRNLLTTTKNTVEFLRGESRVKIYILDQESTYEPLLEYYKEIPEKVYYKSNEGPHSVWMGAAARDYDHLREDYYIVADSDCTYDNVPDDWLDVMFNVLKNSNVHKVGMSLEIDNLPHTSLGDEVKNHEAKYWENKTSNGWVADVDTTFALHEPHTGFCYDAIRLDRPYCIKHTPWYITKDNITEEWEYYLDCATYVSTWGCKLKQYLN